jgi:hypothetical protein
MAEHTKKKSLALYGADRWGSGLVEVNDAGHLCMLAPGLPPVDLHELAELLRENGYRTPFIARFPSRIEKQMTGLSAAFRVAAAQNNYSAGHIALYPLKVNQRRAVVEAVADARTRMSYGLEAGSKPELLLAMAQEVQARIPLVLNGFKDEEFMMMAHHVLSCDRHPREALHSRYRALAEFGWRARQIWADHGRNARGDPPSRCRRASRAHGIDALSHRFADHPDQPHQARHPRSDPLVGSFE